MKKSDLIAEIKALNPAADVDGTVEELESSLAKLQEAAKGTFVAEGKSLCTARGILGPGERIGAKDFNSEGDKTLASFIKKGYIVKVG